MKKLVQLCSFRSLYNDRLQRQLQSDLRFAQEFEIEALYLDEIRSKVFSEAISKGKIRELVDGIKLRKYMDQHYKYDGNKDIINIQFVSFVFLWLLPYLRKNYCKIILTFWGSDLLRQSKKRLVLMRPLFDVADYISFETQEMHHIFNQTFYGRYDDKIKIVRWGIDLLDEIDRIAESDIIEFAKKYGIDRKRKVVVIGYNRGETQQHQEVICSLKGEKIAKEDIFLIFPWSYGPSGEEYKESLLEEIGILYDACFIEEFLSDYEVACLRCIGDIMVQVQTTDSLSSSMLETLYSGNMVITGNWLPYGELKNIGIKMEMVNSPSEVGNKIKDIIKRGIQNDADIRKQNKELLRAFSSWDKNIEKWMQMYR